MGPGRGTTDEDTWLRAPIATQAYLPSGVVSGSQGPMVPRSFDLVLWSFFRVLLLAACHPFLCMFNSDSEDGTSTHLSQGSKTH